MRRKQPEGPEDRDSEIGLSAGEKASAHALEDSLDLEDADLPLAIELDPSLWFQRDELDGFWKPEEYYKRMPVTYYPVHPNGGYKPGEIVCFIAGCNVGKSIFNQEKDETCEAN